MCVQDVDSAYLVKADLEDKVGSLTDEINFLRNIYEEVFCILGNLDAVFKTLHVIFICLFLLLCFLYSSVVSLFLFIGLPS